MTREARSRRRSAMQRWLDLRLVTPLYAAQFLVAKADRRSWRRVARALAGQWRSDRGVRAAIRRCASVNRPGERFQVAVVEYWLPDPAKDGESARIVWIAETLASLGCDVSIVGLRDLTVGAAESGSRVVGRAQGRDAIGSTLGAADMLWLSRPEVAARLLPMLTKESRASLVYNTVDVHSVRLTREAAVTGSRRHAAEAAIMRRLEPRLGRLSDFVVALTDEERYLIEQDWGCTQVVTLPTPQQVAAVPSPPAATREGLLFFGQFAHRANVDAVDYLIQAVAPLIWTRLPNATITIAGAYGPERWRSITELRIRIEGFVEDLDALIDRSRAMLAPLRFGAGMKGKIARSMARGLPVVTTPVGAEGFEIVSGENALIGSDARELAESCVRLLTDDVLWERLSEGSRVTAGAQVGYDVVEQAVRSLLHQVESATDR